MIPEYEIIAWPQKEEEQDGANLDAMLRGGDGGGGGVTEGRFGTHVQKK
jgi:hypothetical protein